MARFPTLTARELIKALERCGFIAEPPSRGSHIKVYDPKDPQRNTTVPSHPGDLPRWLVAAILRQLRLKPDDLRPYL
jgi:predicted RNA binding protein YcfA (HicA-like mRNA interferase family)